MEYLLPKFGLSEDKIDQSQSVGLLQLTVCFVSNNTEIQSLPSHETRTSLFSCSKQRVECKALLAYVTSPIVWGYQPPLSLQATVQ